MKELYEAVLRAMQKQDPNEKSCYNCIVYFIKAELNKLGFYDYKGYHKDSCSSPLFYLEDLGIIKILQGVPGAEYDNLNRRYGVECGKLKIKVCNNPFKYNKI